MYHVEEAAVLLVLGSLADSFKDTYRATRPIHSRLILMELDETSTLVSLYCCLGKEG